MKTVLLMILGLFLISCSHSRSSYHHKSFERMDSNSNGKVSKKEWMSHKEAIFSAMDANSDGEVTKEEKKGFYLSKCSKKATKACPYSSKSKCCSLKKKCQKCVKGTCPKGVCKIKKKCSKCKTGTCTKKSCKTKH